MILTLWPALILVFALAASARAGQAKPQSQPAATVKRIFVEPFEGKLGSAQLRDRVTARLRASHDVKVVDAPSDADLLVRGNGEIWIKGYVAINPHPASNLRQAVYGGYLSLEVENRGGEVLWSYLVTPGRIHWSGVADSMADHIVSLMLAAIQQGNLEPAQPGSIAGSKLTLAGAGSTFSAPLYQQWIESFEALHPEFHATYDPVGSESGIRLLQEGKVDFAASDVPVSDEQMSTMHVKFNQYATVLGGVVPAYNLPGIGRDLQFTPELLAGIYLGKITNWSDAKLRAANHGIHLPNMPIAVLHRSDGSGTSAAWTGFLSRTVPEWKSSVGTGMRVAWPVGEALEGNEAIAARIAQTPGAIGYVELTYAIRHELSFGSVQNASGRFVQASLTTLSAAARTASTTPDLRASLLNAPGSDAYPISTFTWLLVPSAHTAKSDALEELLRWMLTSGQKACSALGYVPLPRDLAAKQLAQVTPAGASADAKASISPAP